MEVEMAAVNGKANDKLMGVEENGSGTGDVELGLRIRDLRTQRGWTLKQMSVLSGLNINTLSLMEKGKTSPSIYTLQRLATAMELPLKEFFEPAQPHNMIVFTAHDRRPQTASEKAIIENLGKGLTGSTLEPFVVTMEKFATSGGRTLIHSGFEFVYCLSGKILYWIQENEYPLNPGDSILFAAQLGHRWENINDGESKLLLVLTPACGIVEQSKKHFYPFEGE
jgi:transcriptional regulator with XRE-family HTH domain